LSRPNKAESVEEVGEKRKFYVKDEWFFLSLGRPLVRVRFPEAGPALGLPARLDLRLG
jgi:hypothetical protein